MGSYDKQYKKAFKFNRVEEREREDLNVSGVSVLACPPIKITSILKLQCKIYKCKKLNHKYSTKLNTCPKHATNITELNVK